MARERFCITETLYNKAVTQWTNYPFNSFCEFNGQYLAANEDGLFTISNEDDNGSDITSCTEFVVDFGTVVHIRSLWIGFETSDSLQLSLTFDDRTSDTQTFTLTPNHTSNQQHSTKIFLGRGDQGRYLTIKISGVDGADWSLDFIEAIVINRGRFYV